LTNISRWNINVDDIKNDLTAGKGRPLWILSTYGPGTNSPASLLDANELSFEELRSRFYELKAAGNELQATNEANALWFKAEQHIADVVNDIGNIIPFMEEAEKKHPNRYDFLKMTGQIPKERVIEEAGSTNLHGGTLGARSSGFGVSNSEAGSGFGSTKTSFGPGASKVSGTSTGAFGQSTPSSGFGAPSFGQPSQPAFGRSALGQTSTASAFGKPGGGAFGQPSGLGQTSQSSGFGTSGFGQLAAKNSFAPASAATFGHPSKPASAFGQTSQPAPGFVQSSSGFGQTSQLGGGFGQPSKPANAFGQPAQAAPSFGAGSNFGSGFGQPSKPAVGFGQPSQTASGFGQPARPALGFGRPAQSTPAFGQTSQPSSGFGQPSQPGPGFGQPSQSSTSVQVVPTSGQPLASQDPQRKLSNPFESGSAAGERFGQAAQLPSGSTNRENPFTTPSSTGPTVLNTPKSPPTAPAPAQAPASTSAPTATASTTTSHQLTSKPPAPTHYTQTLTGHQNQTDPKTKRLTLYKSRPVKYIHDFPCYQRPDGKGWERIWFPDGAEKTRQEDLQPKDEAYTDAVRDKYKHLSETGRFEVGRMPAVAPMREWISFDF
jgi:nucleoporin NUP42